MNVAKSLNIVKAIMQGTVRQTCEYMLVLLVILECNSVYRCVWGRTDSVYYLETFALSFGTVLLLTLLWEDKHRWKYVFQSSILLCSIMLFEILFLFFNVIKTGAVANYMLVFLMFLPLMLVLFKIYIGMGEPYRLFYVLSNIVFFLAALSLVIWVMAVIFGRLQPTGEIIVDWGFERHAENYFNICFYWQTERIPLIGLTIMRNNGIFPEAPMYNIFLNTALMTELFLKEHTDWLRCVIISLTICSTVGTLGILLMAVGWIMKFILNITDYRIKRIFYLIICAVCIVFFVLIWSKWELSNGSFATHIDDYMAPIKAWLVHPIIGCGYENETFIHGFMSEFRLWNPGLSNSITVVLAEGGLVLFLFYLLPFLIFFNQFKFPSGRKTIVPWGIGIFGIYTLIIFHYRFFMMMILALGYSFVILDNECKHICDILHYGIMENNASMLARNKKRNFILTVLIICAIIILISIFSTCEHVISTIMYKYRLGLENSQWRGIVLIMFIIAVIGLIGNIINCKNEWKNIIMDKE